MRLSEIALFEGTSGADCARMLDCFDTREHHFRQGETICDFSESNDDVGILLKGHASIVRLDIEGNQTILERMEEGNIFGELIAFSSLGENSVFVMCDKAATVVFINFYHFTKRCGRACACHSVVVENMFRLVAEKAYTLGQRVEVLSGRSIREKLMCFFYIQSSKIGSATFTLPFGMTALAENICVDRSAMSRELKKMKADSIIAMNGHNITILW